MKAQPSGAVTVRRDKPGTHSEAECVLTDLQVRGRVLGVEPWREACLLNCSGQQTMKMPDYGLIDSRGESIEDTLGERGV